MRLAPGVSTMAMRRLLLVLVAFTLVGMNFHVMRALSPLLRATGVASGVKNVVHEAEEVPPAVMLPRSGPPAPTGSKLPTPPWNHADSRLLSASASTPFSE